MELKRIVIHNFRSIKREEIKFDHNCQILLGKNEAGKSNILKAIAAVFGKYAVSDKDKRKRIDNEKIDRYEIIAEFRVSSTERIRVSELLYKKYTNTSILKFSNGKTIQEYVDTYFENFLLTLQIGNGQKSYAAHWQLANEVEFVLEKKIYLTGNNLTYEPTNASPFEPRIIILNLFHDIYNEKPHTCHYWQYQNNYLLPGSISIEEFTTNPSKVKGLENLFILCGRENIKKEFADAGSQDGDYENMLEQISKTVTETFQKIWSDFKDTEIQLRHSGEEILIKVTNKAKYSFEDRSDGFKKFISILLMLSSPSRANKMQERDIILIDEPDQSLYPTSAQYLRDELLDMAKRSKIIYSTHSQYMIDSTCIERHLIVEKGDDITTIKNRNGNAPFSEDELLRRAIGTSIFECLKSKNLIFEGYLDRELFKKHCSFHKKNDEFKEYGIVYLGGISGAETLTQLLLLANKKFIIVADSDEVSKNKRKDFNEHYPEHKENWLAYGEVCQEVVTMEDFLNTDYLEAELKSRETEFIYDRGKNAMHNIERLAKKDKDKRQEIKNKLVKELKKEHIKDEYEIFLDKLKEKLRQF